MRKTSSILRSLVLAMGLCLSLQSCMLTSELWDRSTISHSAGGGSGLETWQKVALTPLGVLGDVTIDAGFLAFIFVDAYASCCCHR